jgi:hypothetical protein
VTFPRKGRGKPPPVDERSGEYRDFTLCRVQDVWGQGQSATWTGPLWIITLLP